MRRPVGVSLALALLGGCSQAEIGGGVRRGTPITHVQLDYGEPDVISDRSGDLERFYVPTHRPSAEWPWDAPRTFYYLDRNLSVTFARGKAVRTTAISPRTRENTLVPLLPRYAGRK
jgi:hypothetical protein